MLVGVRVLELGQSIAASLTGMLLADLGADVIALAPETACGDLNNGQRLISDRGKQVVSGDIRTAEGLAVAMRLVEGADVVIDGLPRGELAAAGFEVPGPRQPRPGLIVCSLPAYAPELDLDSMPATDATVATFAGFAAKEESSIEGLPVASMYAALLAANCIIAALYARDRCGQGQSIEVPLHSALLLALGFRLVRVDGVPPPQPATNPLVTTYRCADGRWVQLHAGTPRFAAGFMAQVGGDSEG